MIAKLCKKYKTAKQMTVLYIKEVRFLDLLHHDLATILDIDTLGGAVDAYSLQVVIAASEGDVANLFADARG